MYFYMRSACLTHVHASPMFLEHDCVGHRSFLQGCWRHHCSQGITPPLFAQAAHATLSLSCPVRNVPDNKKSEGPACELTGDHLRTGLSTVPPSALLTSPALPRQPLDASPQYRAAPTGHLRCEAGTGMQHTALHLAVEAAAALVLAVEAVLVPAVERARVLRRYCCTSA